MPPKRTLYREGMTMKRICCLILLGFVLGSAAVHASSGTTPVLPSGVTESWYAKAVESIRQSEYQPIRQDQESSDMVQSWQALNRAQNFRIQFSQAGCRVWPRAGRSAWNWGLGLAAYGGTPVTDFEAHPDVTVVGGRVEIHFGDITEWYVNDERGLEHGFTLHVPSESAVASGEAVVWVQITGSLEPRLTPDADAMELWDGEVRAIRYDGLKVLDAAGRALPSRFDLAAAPESAPRLAIRVDARDAVYPIEIDPIAWTPDWTSDGAESDSGYGTSVATAGDVNGDGYSDVIVGAWSQGLGGAAYVFLGSASGVAAAPAWTVLGDQFEAAYGYSVAGAGDVNGDGYADVIVGEDFRNSDGLALNGRVYVYHGSAAGLSPTPNWTFSGSNNNGQFGNQVAGAGDVNGDGYADVIVSAPYSSVPGLAEAGMVYVFHGSSSGLGATPAWTRAGGQAVERLGRSVAGAGDVNADGYADVIVGAHNYQVGAAPDAGRVEVFHGSATGLSAFPDWAKNGTQADAGFGRSVAGAGDVNGDAYSDVVIGEAYYSNGEAEEGRAMVFHGGMNGLAAEPDVIWEGNQAGAYFGRKVAAAGDVDGDGYSDVIVAAPYYSNGQFEEGRIFLFSGGPRGASRTALLTRESNRAEANFGLGLGTAGDVNGDGYAEILVGAPGYSDAVPNAGRAFVYHGLASGPRPTGPWSFTGSELGASLGSTVAAAGDVNADGFDDILIGAPGMDHAGKNNAGRAFLFLGTADGAAVDWAWAIAGPAADAALGTGLAGAGDVNGDGFDDILVGANRYAGDHASEGAAYLYLGSATGPGATPSWSVQGTQEGAQLGRCVAGAGDVNGDGYADVIIGAHGARQDFDQEGLASLYTGSPSGLASAPAWTAAGGAAGIAFGISVAGAGDVNGDGFSDVVVGAPLYQNGQLGEGQARVYHGSATGLNPEPSWTRESDAIQALFGYSVAGAGDVNGDGYADLLVGAPTYSNGHAAEGAFYVFHGSAAGLPHLPSLFLEMNFANAFLGYSVAGAGDLDANGYDDAMVGSMLLNNVGMTLAFPGSAAGLMGSGAGWLGAMPGDYMGWSVAGAGDVNGDAFADCLMGAPGVDNGLDTDAGRAYLYYSCVTNTHPVIPFQRRIADNRRIGRLGLSDSETSFRVGLTARAPQGRDRVRLEWQAAPLGTAFGAAGSVAGTGSTWVVAGPDGTNVSTVVGGLTKNTLYRWRARVAYAPGNSLGLAHGPWRTPGGRGWNLGMVRTHPDATRPTLVLASPASNPTRASGIPVTATFSESVTGLTAAAIQTVNAAVSGFAGSGATYTFTLTPSGRGTVSVTIPANAARDAYGNGNHAASLSRRYVRSAAPNDYDGDGKSDLAVFDNNTGNWYILRVNGTLLLWGQPWGWPGANPKAGDYNGDGLADLAVFDNHTGYWYVQDMNGATVLWALPWGWPGANPVPGDYDGDYVSDLAVFDNNTGYWYILRTDNTVILWQRPWGWPGAVPVAGDYDGDGKSDLAVFDSNTGHWYIQAVDGTVLLWGLAWGWPGAWPVPGDYDNDGKGDLAVFDTNTGFWYILRTDGSLILWQFGWGWPGAVPVAGDYDGDGRSDLAVFDNNTGYWYIITVQGTQLAWALAWGWPGAVPIPGMCW
jgi:hypothetical protein